MNKGTIIDVVNLGTIVLVILSDGTKIPFDHRMFHDFAEANDFDLRNKVCEYNPKSGMVYTG